MLGVCVYVQEHDRESIYLERELEHRGEKREKEERESRPHAFANWHSQTTKLIKDEKAFSEASQLSRSPLSSLCHLNTVANSTTKARF